eukprot:TRINITY_DN2771_c0_g1_i1.p1 TRINITY_DN2771_c0_g1~~TRINITY_DN2771_c0_g1_i1.p1  ORF type:complete len:222 (+),score=58.24 TRINITY_DN2771_c0_g1_i1:73-738(+)
MGAKPGKEDFADLAQETSLSHADLEDLLKTFNRMANKDGMVVKEDLKAAIKKKYGSDDSALSNCLFNLFDQDGSKAINFREFALAFGYLTNKSLEDVVETSFRILDLNGDGHISPGEMRAVVLMNAKMKKYVNVHKRSIPLDKVVFTAKENGEINTEADKIFAMIDVNKDKEVSKAEFIKVANSNPELKSRLAELLIKDEGVNLFASAEPPKKINSLVLDQ